MSDLISRSTAMKNYCNALCPKLQKGEYCNNCIVKAWMNNQPTAYDTDKVVEKLEEVKNKDTEIALDEAQKERCFWYAQGMNRAIEIVKGGGVDE